MGQQGTHGGTHPAAKWPLMPRGGYQRAIPRDALTGEPIRPDTIHKRAHDPLGARDNEAHTPRKRDYRSRSGRGGKSGRLPEPLPTLLLDDLAALERQAVVESEAADGE